MVVLLLLTTGDEPKTSNCDWGSSVPIPTPLVVIRSLSTLFTPRERTSPPPSTKFILVELLSLMARYAPASVLSKRATSFVPSELKVYFAAEAVTVPNENLPLECIRSLSTEFT